MSNIGWNNIFPRREFKSSISSSKLFEKYDPSLSEFKTIFFSQSIILTTEFCVEFVDFFEDFFDGRVHISYG